VTPGTARRAHATDAWNSWLAECFAGLSAVPGADDASGSITTSRLGDVSVFDVRGTTQVVRRSATNARRQPLELLKACVLVDGLALVEQDGFQVPLEPGELALYDTSGPYQIRLTGPWRCAVMTIPRTALAFPERLVTEVMCRPHGVRYGAGRLLVGYLRDCITTLGGAAGTGSGRIGEAGVALLAGALTANGIPAVDADADQARARIVEYIRARVRSPELSPANVAAAHHLSLRTLQRLFEGEERNVAGLIREQRLEAIRHDLADPLLARYSIATIAACSCVTNQSWLSRAFRSRFGLSPSEYRIHALPAGTATMTPA
jgi:AraC-like DNA-binding protein